MKIALALTEATILTELGERTQRYRVGLNLSQAELAKKAATLNLGVKSADEADDADKTVEFLDVSESLINAER